MKSPLALFLLATLAAFSTGCFLNEEDGDSNSSVDRTTDSHLIGSWASQPPKRSAISGDNYSQGILSFESNGGFQEVQYGTWYEGDTGVEYNALPAPDTTEAGKWVNVLPNVLRLEYRLLMDGVPNREFVGYLGYVLHGDSLFTWPVAAYAGSGDLVGSKLRIDEEVDTSSTYDSILLTQDGHWINWFHMNGTLASVDTPYTYKLLDGDRLVRWGDRAPLGDTLQVSRYDRGYLMTKPKDVARRMSQPLIRKH